MYISPNSLKCTSRMSNFIGYKLYLQKLINKNTHFASKDKVILNKNKRTRQKSVLQPHKIRVTLQACIQFRSKKSGGYQKEFYAANIEAHLDISHTSDSEKVFPHEEGTFSFNKADVSRHDAFMHTK